MWVVLGAFFLWVGGVMMFRGWFYTLKPEAPRTLKRKARNVELGLPTDMKVFGRKVRRVGTILVALGITLASTPWWGSVTSSGGTP